MAERSLVLPECSVALPERSGMLPQRSLVLPERSVALPERSVVLPERSGMLPERSLALPEHSAVLHESSTPAFGRLFVFLAVDGHQSPGSLGLDLSPSLPSEGLQGAEEGDPVRGLAEEADDVVLVELFGELRKDLQDLFVEGACGSTQTRCSRGRWKWLWLWRFGLRRAPDRLERLELSPVAGLQEVHGQPELVVQGPFALLEFVAGHLLHCNTKGACVASQAAAARDCPL